MPLIDVTLPLSENVPRYPGDPPFTRWRYRTLDGGPYEVSLFTFGSHAGTHLDAPRHFLPGADDVAALAPELLCGPARVIDLRGSAAAISPEVLREHLANGARRVLLRTLPGLDLERELTTSGAYLTLSAARHLSETGVCLVGIDRLSIEADTDPDYPVHHVLLSAGIPIIEGLDLRNVPPGEYKLWCLPLRILEADGAPARVLLEPYSG